MCIHIPNFTTPLFIEVHTLSKERNGRWIYVLECRLWIDYSDFANGFWNCSTNFYVNKQLVVINDCCLFAWWCLTPLIIKYFSYIVAGRFFWGGNNRHVTSHWQTLSYSVVHLTPIEEERIWMYMHMSDYLTLYLNNKIKVKNNSYIAVLPLINPIFNPLSTNLISWVYIPLRMSEWGSVAYRQVLFA